MFLPRHKATVLLSVITSISVMSPSFANSLTNWNRWADPVINVKNNKHTYIYNANTSHPTPQYAAPISRGHAMYRQSEPQTRFRQISYSQSAPSTHNSPLQRGLNDLAGMLAKRSKWSRVPLLGNQTTNKALLETVQGLLQHNWGQTLWPNHFKPQFHLLPIHSAKGQGKANLSGYFTPILKGSRHKTPRFHVPVYRNPKGWLSKLSHQKILDGALRNKGLEIVWLEHPFDLYIAQVQGSAIIELTDGSRTMLNYAGTNRQPFIQISRYMRQMNYRPTSFSNENVKKWLLQHPDKVRPVLLSNPRYVFFTEDQTQAQTASGLQAIPGHTIAVDSKYIPHGSVLLVELPKVDARGKRLPGSEWKLLFAQDRGKAIIGAGRIDLYTGVGKHAESKAYALTGAHRAYLVLRKPG